MCTALSSKENGHLFGRTLDIEKYMGEKVVLTPKNFPLKFKYREELAEHFAILGMAVIMENTPLYFDGINEYGLCAAALNFPKECVYHTLGTQTSGVASFEVIPLVLSVCKTVDEAEKLLWELTVTSDGFSQNLPPTTLHWIIADKSRSITVESVAEGLKIYENPVGVLTNSPCFPYHLTHLADFMTISPEPPENTLCKIADITAYSGGLGGMGLPGDFSSASRFVRTVFAENHAKKAVGAENISRFFKIMDTVTIPEGLVKTEKGENMYTLYTSCADAENFIYYYTTRGCRRISAVSPRKDLLSSAELISYTLITKEDIAMCGDHGIGER